MTSVLPRPLIEDDGLPVRPSLELFQALAAGVTVVTSRDPDGPVGATASSVTSLSVRPALLLACLAADTRTLRAIRRHRAFAVHLLREGQQERSHRFSRPGLAAEDRFAGEHWDDVLGVPVFRDALAYAICLVEDERVYGDHSIVVGRITAARRTPGRPLVWHDRGYWEISRGG